MCSRWRVSDVSHLFQCMRKRWSGFPSSDDAVHCISSCVKFQMSAKYPNKVIKSVSPSVRYRGDQRPITRIAEKKVKHEQPHNQVSRDVQMMTSQSRNRRQPESEMLISAEETPGPERNRTPLLPLYFQCYFWSHFIAVPVSLPLALDCSNVLLWLINLIVLMSRLAWLGSGSRGNDLNSVPLATAGKFVF